MYISASMYDLDRMQISLLEKSLPFFISPCNEDGWEVDARYPPLRTLAHHIATT